MKEEKQDLPEYSGLTIQADDSNFDEYVEKVRLDKKNREIIINGKVRIQNIPELAFEYKVGSYPPIEWISNYLVREEDKGIGIVWDPKIRVAEFVDIVKKLVAFSEKALGIKERLREIYDISNQIHIRR